MVDNCSVALPRCTVVLAVADMSKVYLVDATEGLGVTLTVAAAAAPPLVVPALHKAQRHKIVVVLVAILAPHQVEQAHAAPAARAPGAGP